MKGMFKKQASLLMALMVLFLAMALGLAQEAEEGLGDVMLNADGMAEGAKPELMDMPIKGDYGSIVFPQVVGTGNDGLEAKVNELIYQKGKIESRILTLNALSQDGWGLLMDYIAVLENGILSIRMSAVGEMENGRSGQEYSTVNYNLNTGREITLSDIFIDIEGAFAYMENVLDEEVRPDLSGHMEYDEITPIARDNFYLTPQGITFYYPNNKFTMVSGYSGSCSFFYYELRDFINSDADGVIDLLGGIENLAPNENTKDKIISYIDNGMLPGVPAVLGTAMPEVFNLYRRLSDADLYPGGRFFSVEDGMFRGLWLMTDGISSGYEHSVLQGLRATRMNLFGIITGETEIGAWREVLGEPESSISLSEETAHEYWLVPGTSDYYTFDGYTLRLHADDDGVLYCVYILLG